MPNLVHQSQIPLLPILYHAKRLGASPRPLAQPSALLNSKVGLIRTDITKLGLPNGAIVNAANNGLLNGGGVCGAIHNAAGGELLAECIQLNGCDTGDAKITGAYNLPCKNVIHGVGPIYWQARRTNEHSSLLSSCYMACLKLAAENGLDTIAFPAVSTGIYGYPSYEAAETAISTVRKFLETEAGERLKLVIFCNFEVKDEVAYLELLPNFFPPDNKKPPAAAANEPAVEGKKPLATTGVETIVNPKGDTLEHSKEVSVEDTPALSKKPHSAGDRTSGDEDDGFVVINKDGCEAGHSSAG